MSNIQITKRRSILLTILAATMGLACAAPSMPTDADEAARPGGKADDPSAPEPLTLGVAIERDLLRDQEHVFVFDAEVGDVYESALEAATDPGFFAVQAMYRGDFFEDPVDIRVRSHEDGRTTETRRQRIRTAGQHKILVSSFLESFDGRYRLRVECVDGPCLGGEPAPGQPVATTAANACLAEATLCALDALLDPLAADAPIDGDGLLHRCLEVRAEDCAETCDALDEHCVNLAYRIDWMIAAGDDGGDVASCASEARGCFTDCAAGATEAEGVEELTTAACWNSDWSDCSFYIEGLEVCGGLGYGGEAEACAARCEATLGPWSDGPFTECLEERCGERK